MILYKPKVIAVLSGCILLLVKIDAFMHLDPNEYIAEDQPIPEEVSKSSLKFVIIATRHGSRSPLSTYPTDPYPVTDRKFWPRGKGQLSNLGKQQMFNTGETLKKRYRQLLGESYYPNDTVVQYNPYDRDFNSGALILAGLYPPKGREIWNKKLLWDPIPMSVRQFDVCDVNITCPKYNTIQMKQWDKQNENASEYSDLLKYLSDNTGRSVTFLTDIYDIYDTLLMQSENGYKLPKWTKKVFPDKIKGFALNFLVVSYAENDDLLRLGAGPELKHFSDILNYKASNLSINTKMYIETSHDCTLIALLHAMGYNDSYLEVPTSAYITYELHEIDGSLFIKIFYYRSTNDKNPVEITLPSQENPLPLEAFNTFADNLNPKNYQEECNS